MSGISTPSTAQQVRIIHLGKCSVANPNLKNKNIHKTLICKHIQVIKQVFKMYTSMIEIIIV